MDTDGHGLETNLTEAVIGSLRGLEGLGSWIPGEMLRELTLRGVNAKTQVSFPVCYKGQYVGEYCADF